MLAFRNSRKISRCPASGAHVLHRFEDMCQVLTDGEVLTQTRLSSFSDIGSPFSFHAGKAARCIGDRNGMLSLVLWSSKHGAGLPTVGRQRASNAGRRPTVDNPCAKPGEFKVCRSWFSIPTADERTSRSAFSDTHHSWQVAASEGGTCTRRLRIEFSKRSTFTALASSPRVRLRSTTNTQGSPSYRLTILPSQNASRHVPNVQCITLGDAT